MSTFTDIRDVFVKIGLPLLGAALPVPGGAALGVALANAIGAPDATPAAILQTLTTDPAAAEKAREFEASNKITIMQLNIAAEQAVANAEFTDRADARNLATQEIAKGNAITCALAASVRPVWGLGAFIIVAYSVLTNYTISANLESIIEMVLMFYFGGRTIEKITPHAAQVMQNNKRS